MSDPSPQMKPQETTIFLLGELKGETRAIREGLSTSQTQQAEVNAENRREHEEFRRTLGMHESTLAVLSDNKTTLAAVQLSRPQKIALWISAPSSLAALLGLLTVYLTNQH